VSGLASHRRLPIIIDKLDPSVGISVGGSGPHDFAVRVHRRSSGDDLASTASRLTFVTTRTPLSSRRDGGIKDTISDFRKGEFLACGDRIARSI
jgi:hypothetical protein